MIPLHDDVWEGHSKVFAYLLDALPGKTPIYVMDQLLLMGLVEERKLGPGLGGSEFRPVEGRGWDWVMASFRAKP